MDSHAAKEEIETYEEDEADEEGEDAGEEEEEEDAGEEGEAGAGGDTACLQVMSFGYRYGAAHNTWHTVNLRALPNPASNRALSRHATGLSGRLAHNLFSTPEAEHAYQRARVTLQSLVDEASDAELYTASPMAFGCNLGRHRSVAFVERLVSEGLGPRVRLSAVVGCASLFTPTARKPTPTNTHPHPHPHPHTHTHTPILTPTQLIHTLNTLTV
jgi:RapZ C-terminal domain